MSAENPYEQLGISEDASFDEIQAARNRLTQEYSGDHKRVEMVEAAYDAILMERLRMRQEGKIKVPERIRFAERLAEAPPSSPPTPIQQSPAWLQRLLDTPSRTDILWPAGVFLGLSVISVFYGSLALALGVLASLYFLTRKEGKLGRSMLLSLAGLTIGLLLWGGLDALLAGQLTSFNLAMAKDTIAACVTFVVLWLVSSFLR